MTNNRSKFIRSVVPLPILFPMLTLQDAIELLLTTKENSILTRNEFFKFLLEFYFPSAYRQLSFCKEESDKEEKKPAPFPHDAEKDKELKKLQKKFSEAELRVADLQKKKTLAESQLGDPGIYADKNKFQDAEKKYQDFSKQLKQAEAEYEKLFEELMK